MTNSVCSLPLLIVLAWICAIHALPRGFTTYFSTPCPSGWVEQSSAWGRLIVSVNDSRFAGVKVNEPLGNLEVRGHTHDYKSSQFTITDVKYCTGPGLGGDVVSQGLYSIAGSVVASGSSLPLVQFRLCTLQADSTELQSPKSVAYFFDVNTCPPAWQPFTAANGRAIVIGTPSDPQPASNATKPLASGENRNHTHTFQTAFKTDSVGLIATIEGCGYGVGRSGSYPIRGDTTSSQEGVPYLQALTCQAINGSASVNLPIGAMFFTEGPCPPNYKPVSDFSGRFVVATPPGGSSAIGFGGAPIVDSAGYKKHQHMAGASLTTRPHRLSAWVHIADPTNVAMHRQYGWTFMTDEAADAASVFPWLSVKMCARSIGLFGERE